MRFHPYWKTKFQALDRRIGRAKAIVAIARKLLVVIWHVLIEQAADRQADPEAVARSLMTWGSRHSLAASLGLSRSQFVQQGLQQLGIGHDLERSSCGSTICHLPTNA